MATAVLSPQAAAPHAPTMNPSTSLTSRRIATSTNLPGPLELPVNAFGSKLNMNGNPISTVSISAVSQQQTPSSINNLLTPTSNIPGESLSPLSSGGSNSNSNSAPGNYWPSSYNGGTGTTPGGQTSGPGQPNQPWSMMNFNQSRGRFSPSLQSLMRNHSGSPNVTEGAPPSYELGALPPFPQSMSQPATPANAQQQQQPHQDQQQHQQHPQHSQQSSMGSYAVSSPGPLSGIPSQLSPPASADGAYPGRLPPTPTFYGGSQPSGTPQSSQFSPYGASSASPPGSSALAHSSGAQRLSPVSSMPSFRTSYSSYGMPPAGMMPGIHSPGSPPGLMGGPGGLGVMPPFHSGTIAAQTHMFGGGHMGQAPQERPFKCDQCPQSFNRNHDLKRHKRIHLAVKPFPCGHCDKSFSRKDALKVRSLRYTTFVDLLS